RIVEHLRAKGFVRVVVDGAVRHLDELAAPKPNLAKAKELLVVTDRLVVGPTMRTRLADALETAFGEGDGDAVVVLLPGGGEASAAAPVYLATALRFITAFRCPNDGHLAPAPSPQLFSFNNPRGACPTCNGFGATLDYDEALIVPYPERSLAEGALDPW